MFTGDHSARTVGLEEFSREADVLVAHMAIAEHTTGVAARLHRRPSEIGAEVVKQFET